jgi:DEAD/DEAH box helicase domain-containing protein
MHTTAFWLTLSPAFLQSLQFPISDRQDGMNGLLYALESIASLLLMCDRLDLGSAIGEGGTPSGGGEWPVSPPDGGVQEYFEPTLYLYDAYPGGIGLSEPLYRMYASLLHKTLELIAGCGCEKGCPSCVGPAGEAGSRAKEVARVILERLCLP